MADQDLIKALELRVSQLEDELRDMKSQVHRSNEVARADSRTQESFTIQMIVTAVEILLGQQNTEALNPLREAALRLDEEAASILAEIVVSPVQNEASPR